MSIRTEFLSLLIKIQIQGLETQATEDDDCLIEDIEKSLTSPLLQKETFWLSSNEIANLVKQKGL